MYFPFLLQEVLIIPQAHISAMPPLSVCPGSHAGLEIHKIVYWSWGPIHHEIYWSPLISTGPQIKGWGGGMAGGGYCVSVLTCIQLQTE